MKVIYCLIIFLCPLVNRGQTVKALTIGDTVPDLILTNVYNYPSATIRLSDLKGKLVILDFWATWCTACIREFPKLDSLQSRFKDGIQIVLVSSAGSNTIKDIQQFLKKHLDPAGKKYTFPYTANDTTLTKRFPHLTIPQMVWLYNGKVTAITDAEEISTANIQQVLQDNPVSFEMKEDVMNFDPSKSLLDNSNGANASALIRKSVFTRYLKGMGSRSGLSVDADSSLQSFYVTNQPALKLYAIALPGIAPNRLIIENTDTGALIHPGNDKAWEQANFYSYEITLPVTASLANIHRAMLKDLNGQFNLNSHIENRTVACYALVQTPDVAISGMKDHNAVNSTDTKEATWVLENKPVSAFCDALNYQVPGEPLHPVVLDETNITGPVSLQLPVTDIQDLPSVKAALHAYGLDIIKVTRTIRMLVLSGTGASDTNTIYSSSN